MKRPPPSPDFGAQQPVSDTPSNLPQEPAPAETRDAPPPSSQQPGKTQPNAKPLSIAALMFGILSFLSPTLSSWASLIFIGITFFFGIFAICLSVKARQKGKALAIVGMAIAVIPLSAIIACTIMGGGKFMGIGAQPLLEATTANNVQQSSEEQSAALPSEPDKPQPETPEEDAGLTEESWAYWNQLKSDFDPSEYVPVSYSELTSCPPGQLVRFEGYYGAKEDEGDGIVLAGIGVDGDPTQVAVVGFTSESFPNDISLHSSVRIYGSVIGLSDDTGEFLLFGVEIEPAEEPDFKVQAPSGNSMPSVEFSDFRMTTNSTGAQELIVELAFENTTDRTTCFDLSYTVKAFQDGVELDPVFYQPNLDLSTGSKDIKPGGSLTVYEAFELSSMDPVEVEVYEWLSWDDTPILNSTVEIE